jgi:hypothetical protein
MSGGALRMGNNQGVECAVKLLQTVNDAVFL